MQHAGTPRQPSDSLRGDWSHVSHLMTRAAGGGRLPYAGPAPHRTAHTTTTTSIAMVPKTAATGARQHHPPRLPPEGIYQATSVVTGSR